MKCVSYTRAIPWLESEKILSIDEQNEIIRGYLKGRKGYTLIKKYTDRKRDKDEETAFQELIAAGMRKEYDCIIVAKLEYLGVSVNEVYHIIYKELYVRGIAFIGVKDGFNSLEHREEEVCSFIRQKMGKVCSARIKNCYKNQRLKNKGYCKHATYGYMLSDNNFQKDIEVSPILDEIFLRVKAGEKLADIANDLNQRGIETPSRYLYDCGLGGKRSVRSSWTTKAIYEIVSNRTYIGEFRYNSQYVDVTDHEAYISLAEFEEIAARLEKGYGGENLTKKSCRVLFFREMYCIECGKPIRICVYEPNGEEKLHCKTECKHWKKQREWGITESDLVGAVLQKLKGEIHLAKLAKQHIEFGKYEEGEQISYNRLSDKMKGIISDMRKTVPSFMPYYEMAKSGEISQEEYRQRRTEYFAWLQSYEEKINPIMEQIENLKVAYTERNPWIKLFATADEDIESLNTYKRFIKHIDVSFPHQIDEKLNLNVTFKKTEWKDLLAEPIFGEL